LLFRTVTPFCAETLRDAGRTTMVNTVGHPAVGPGIGTFCTFMLNNGQTGEQQSTTIGSDDGERTLRRGPSS